MTNQTDSIDILMIGSGIMSATAAALLHELQPNLSIGVFERLDRPAAESSEVMNNAGTGHAANCELNYTPELNNGSIDIAKALTINESYEESLQFWSHLVEKNQLSNHESFFFPMQHVSFVRGEANIGFLRKRHELLSGHHMFKDMTYTEDHVRIGEWAPLLIQGRESNDAIAATRVSRGSDVDFGQLTKLLFQGLEKNDGFTLHLNQNVTDLKKEKNGRWLVTVKNNRTGAARKISAGFVFIGGGGGSLPLLMKSNILEGRGYGGMPVSGQWLVCTNQTIIEQHHGKVYGKAPLGAPPMSVPHLDTRIINGRKALLFGPYAGFTTRYLRYGSLLDLPLAVKPSNIKAMTIAGLRNAGLVKYLVSQVLQSHEDRVATLREFVPSARVDDWQLENAGVRVQIIKPDPELGGKLEFGTEVVTSSDGTLAALMGASPGASTAVTSMCDMIFKCFAERAEKENWRKKMTSIIPSFGHDLTKDRDLCANIRERCNAVLGLKQ